MLENEGWECPTVNKGDAVEVSSNPESMAGSCPGTVTQVFLDPKTNTVTAINVLVIRNGGHKYLRAVHHIDDPALQDNPHWLKEPETGVFRVAQSTQLLRDNAATIAYLKGAVNKLVKRVDELESPQDEPEFEPTPAPEPVPDLAAELNEPPPEIASEPAPPVKRGRGRPRKNTPEPVGAAAE